MELKDCIMVIHATPYVEVRYNLEKEIISILWKSKPSTDELRKTYTDVLQLVTKAYPSSFFCTDLSACGPLDQDQENWLSQEYYQQVYDSLKTHIYAAVIFTDEHFKAIISNYRATDFDLTHEFIHFNYFTQSEEAMQWLEHIKKGQDVLLIPDSTS